MSGQHPKKDDIIKNPENYDEMITKLKEREDEQIKRMLEKWDAASLEDLKAIANKAITSRALRTSTEHKPLKDRTVLVDPKSEDVNKLKQTIEKETTELAKRVLNELRGYPSLASKLKGRIKPPESPPSNHK